MAKNGLDNFLKSNDFENVEGQSNIWEKIIDLREDKADYSDDKIKDETVKVPEHIKVFYIWQKIKSYSTDNSLISVYLPTFEFDDNENIILKDDFSKFKDKNKKIFEGKESDGKFIDIGIKFLKDNHIEDESSYNKFFIDLYNKFLQEIEESHKDEWRERFGKESTHAKARKQFGNPYNTENVIARDHAKYDKDQHYKIKLQLICADSDWNNSDSIELHCRLKMKFGQSIFGYNNYERGEFGKLIQKTHKEDNNKRSEWDKNIIEKNFIIKYSDNEDEIKQTIFNIVNKALTEKLDGEAPKKAFSLIFKTKAQAETARTKEKYNEELKGTDI